MVAHGIGAAKRSNRKRNKARQARKKSRAAAAASPLEQQSDPALSLHIPPITEDDLLAFQISHFGIDVSPHTWFVDAEVALSYDPRVDDDGLGWYEDGTKRTLTDEQVEMFRHSEVEMLLREQRLRMEQENAEVEQENPIRIDSNHQKDKQERSHSPISDASSIEGELMGLAREEPASPPRQPSQRPGTPSSRSGTSHSSNQRPRQRTHEVPYDKRNKRKWENYIEENDPVEGSLTHRRIAREMDEQYSASVDLDY